MLGEGMVVLIGSPECLGGDGGVIGRPRLFFWGHGMEVTAINGVLFGLFLCGVLAVLLLQLFAFFLFGTGIEAHSTLHT